jgi:hypothetical protein
MPVDQPAFLLFLVVRMILNQLVAGYCPNKPLVERSSRSTLAEAINN